MKGMHIMDLKNVKMGSERYRKLHRELWNGIATEVWILYKSGKLREYNPYMIKGNVIDVMLTNGLITNGEYEECKVNAFCFACVYTTRCYWTDKEAGGSRCSHCIIKWVENGENTCTNENSLYYMFINLIDKIQCGFVVLNDNVVNELEGLARQIANMEWNKYE